MMDKIIVILGATASKKTTLAKKICEYFDSEIINADAFQIYQFLNIGTNKSSKAEIEKYHMHLIDIFELDQNIDIAIYQKLCNEKIKAIIAKNKIPIICGGSNLYIDAVIKGYNLDKVASREAISYFDNWSYDEIYNYVLKHDKETALKINKNNKKRIIRAAQIIYSLNNKKTNVEKEMHQYVYDCFIIETIFDRELLYKNINKRVDLMQATGFVKEVENILKLYPNFLELQSSKAIGYGEVANALIHNQPIDWELIKQKTRNYAKKQLTWNRNKYDNKITFDVSRDDLSRLIKDIDIFLKK